MKVALVGVGLIGGSMAISLKESGWASKVIGVDLSREHLDMALRRKIIDVSADLDKAVDDADVILVATPVDVMVKIIPMILDRISPDQIVSDVGSSKTAIGAAIATHSRRGRFVSAHPMAGTEFAGPDFAIPHMFDNRCTVVCDRALCDKDALDRIESMYNALKMKVLYMKSDDHDVHAAYISHISHILSLIHI